MRYLLSHRLLQGRMAKWVVVLQEFDLEFISPKSTKALALAALMTDPINHVTTTQGWPPWLFCIHHIHGGPMVWGHPSIFTNTEVRGTLKPWGRRRIWHQAIRHLLIGDVCWALIYWCKSNLHFLSIRVGRLRGISKYQDSKLDLFGNLVICGINLLKD